MLIWCDSSWVEGARRNAQYEEHLAYRSFVQRHFWRQRGADATISLAVDPNEFVGMAFPLPPGEVR
jgi:hypothetical protein